MEASMHSAVPLSTGSQEFTEAVFNNPAPVESEDCMYLNVYAPSTPAPADGRTVMFWIYGGSLQFGNAGQPAYDGSWFASYEDVIVVTTNYRTNGKSVSHAESSAMFAEKLRQSLAFPAAQNYRPQATI